MSKQRRLFVSALVLSCFLATSPLHATESTAQPTFEDIQKVLNRLEPLENLVKSQQKAIEEQKHKLAEQEKELAQYKKKLKAEAATASKEQHPTNIPPTSPKPAQVAASEPSARPAAPHPTTSITAPAEPENKVRPQINVLPDAGGILTPKGTLVYENSLEYTNTTSNVFSFDGVQVADVVLVGNVSATAARRQVIQDSSRLRMGLTNRLEVDFRVPYVYRNDTTTSTLVSGGTNGTRIEGHDIGDIDMGLAYQLNQGRDNWPFFVANLRYKSNTGVGPYDIAYNSNNVAETLPTGTGFHSAEASVTMIKVTDPAVLFTNIGYVHSFGQDINKNFNTTRILEVDPGDTINFSGGLGFSINQDTSFTLGYKHSYVFGTDQTAMSLSSGSTVKTTSDALNVGALLVGASYKLSPKTNLNFTVEVGATRDAPDVHVALRLPFELAQFY